MFYLFSPFAVALCLLFGFYNYRKRGQVLPMIKNNSILPVLPLSTVALAKVEDSISPVSLLSHPLAFPHLKIPQKGNCVAILAAVSLYGNVL